MRNKIANICWGVVKHWKITVPVLAVLVGAGWLSYSMLLPREGFPPIQFPLTVVNVVSPGNDATSLDNRYSKTISENLNNDPLVDKVQTSARDNFLNIVVFFDESVQPEQGTELVKNQVEKIKPLKNTQLTYTSINPAQYLNKYDALIAVYAKNGQSIQDNQIKAEEIATALESIDEIDGAKAEPLTAEVNNPVTGEKTQQQLYFNQIGVKNDDSLEFYPSITVGVTKTDGTDVIELSEAVNSVLESERDSAEKEKYGLAIGADFAETVSQDVNNLQTNLLTGIAAVVVVTILLINWRASLITALFMVSVVLITLLIFYFIGYSLNVITLFALVLTIGLFVDDATIMAESIDAERKKLRSREKIIKQSAKKVALASFAGTLTTVLVFAPLAFIGGILGSFIRLMPITVVISLLVSYVLSLVLVPVLARFTVLKSLTTKQPKFTLYKLEQGLANAVFISISWLKTKHRRGVIWGSSMVGLSIAMIIIGGMIFSGLGFNIFPPSKDSDQIQVNIEYVPGLSIKEAESIASEFNQVIAQEAAGQTKKVLYGGFTQATDREADAVIQLTPIDQRDGDNTAIKISERIEPKLKAIAGKRAAVRVNQIDAGPPSVQFPFMMQIYGEDSQKSQKLAEAISEYLSGSTIKKPNGDTATVEQTKIDYTDGVTRLGGRRVVQVSTSFTSDDVSALVVGAQESVEKEFNDEKLATFGFTKDDIGFDFGQESENADSFNSLGLIFPIALGLMFLVLAFQFRSILQPLLIFLAIPFSIFGIGVGLSLSNNPLSFFAMIGAIGLVGIAVNNTIMLTDYANQARQIKKNTLVDAIAIASKERFRPLITTTITTVVALLPLALFDPFWQPLAVVIIGGLISSTLLVILAFPYYYYGVTVFGVWVRSKFRRKKSKK